MGRKSAKGPELMRLFISIMIIGGLAAGGYYYWNNSQRSSPNPVPIVTSAKSEKPVPRTMAEVRSAPVTVYYDNGQIKAQRNFSGGMLNGAYKLFYEDGTLKEEGFYKDDQLEGELKRYYNSGRLKAQEVYQDNVLISRKTFDDQ